MSFLIDYPSLVAGGELYARRAPERLQSPAARKVAGVATMSVFWGVSIPLYLNRPWTKRWMRGLPARDGRDWMINSGVLSIDSRRVSTRGHLLSALMLAIYPLFLIAGYRHGRRARLARP